MHDGIGNAFDLIFLGIAVVTFFIVIMPIWIGVLLYKLNKLHKKLERYQEMEKEADELEEVVVPPDVEEMPSKLRILKDEED